jgi:hypothetical protein
MHPKIKNTNEGDAGFKVGKNSSLSSQIESTSVKITLLK